MKFRHLAAAALLLAACSPKARKGWDGKSSLGIGQKGSASGPGADADAVEASLRYKSYSPSADLAAIGFDYDLAVLTEESRETLKRNAAWLKAHPKEEIRISGHCDERGTRPYNLALGQKRANAVRDYYKMLGVRAGRIATISYGAELPPCRESTEECWKSSRRAESDLKRK